MTSTPLSKSKEQDRKLDGVFRKYAPRWYVCRPEKVPALLEQTGVVKALREVAMHLMHRETPYQESHCFPLADAILARASAMASSKATE